MTNYRAGRRSGGSTSVTTSLATSEVDGNSTSGVTLSEDFLERMSALHCALEADLLACDAKWTLFVAAALSYRYDSQLRPYPQRYASEQSGCNINELVSVINDTPKLSVVMHMVGDGIYDDMDLEVLELLYWVLVDQHEPTLRPLDDDEYDTLMRCVCGQKQDAERPTHVFEVCTPLHSRSGSSYMVNRSGADNYEVAYYGNKLDSFFSVLTFGFMQHQCTANNFSGPPLVLKKELGACLTQSPIGAGWGASSCGSMIACVALCEYTNVPESVEYQECTATGGGGGTDIIVRNSDLVRVRYLLFYGSRFPEEEVHDSQLFSWVNRHKYSLSLAAYMLMLASIGVANSGSGQYLKHIFSRKAVGFLDFCKRIFVSD